MGGNGREFDVGGLCEGFREGGRGILFQRFGEWLDSIGCKI